MAYKMDGYNNRVPMLTFPIKLDMGAGQFPREGYTRLDFDTNGADIVWDLAHGIPLPDDSVSDFITSHVLEHFLPTDYHYILREIIRVCQNGSTLTIIVPHEDTPEGKLPCHYRTFNEDNFKAINQWLPHTESMYFDLTDISRDGYSLVGKFKIVKNNV